MASHWLERGVTLPTRVGSSDSTLVEHVDRRKSDTVRIRAFQALLAHLRRREKQLRGFDIFKFNYYLGLLGFGYFGFGVLISPII